MRTVDLLVLANSRKLSGKCLAGLVLPELTEWVRPISPHTAQGEVPKNQLWIFDGHLQRLIQPLDVVKVSLNKRTTTPFHPEDWGLSDKPINFIRKFSMAELGDRLRQRDRRNYTLLDLNGQKSITAENAQSGLSHSIETILVDSPSLFRDQYGKFRTNFSFNHFDYSYIPITHPMLEEAFNEGSLPDAKQWYFTISLTEEYNGSHWMVVAAGLPLLE